MIEKGNGANMNNLFKCLPEMVCSLVDRALTFLYLFNLRDVLPKV